MKKYYLLDEKKASTAIKNRQLTVTVIGQGKMGLPLSVVFLDAGYQVIGVDIDPLVVDAINKGDPPILSEPGVIEGIKKGLEKENYYCTLSLEESVKRADILVIIIPVLLDSYKNPNLSPLVKLMQSIGTYLQGGELVIIECTLPPTTTNDLMKNCLESTSDLQAGVDFGLGFAPERTYSGRAIQDIRSNYPKIVGGINSKSTKYISLFYASLVEKGVIEMSSATAAEAVKIFKGVYRDTNIALANELAKIAEKLDINVYEIIDAANSEPFCHIHLPGAGVGGHCIPVYPQFLIDIADKIGVSSDLIKRGREINSKMPMHVINRIIQGLNQESKSVKGAKIALLGLTYRGNVKEHRYTPTLDLIKYLKEYEPAIVLTDPLYEKEEIKQLIDVPFEKELDKALKEADCVIILADHDEYKEGLVEKIEQNGKNPVIVIDTKNLVKASKIKNGKVIGIGK